MVGKPIGTVALTATERQRRWREKVRKAKLLAGKRDRAALRPPRIVDAGDQDLWSTPPELIAALLGFVLPVLPAGPIWEPAAGAGAIVDALRHAGRQVVASDIARQRRDILQLDYLRDPPPPGTHGATTLTNPPFSKLDEFMARSLALIDAGQLAAAVLLVRSDFGGTDGRAEMFNRASAEWECCMRTRWIPGSTGNPRWWCHWVLWRAGCSGPPVHTRLRRKQL
jgi:hypothetical protein